MMQYPLEQLSQIKLKRLEEAEKILKEKKELLSKEETKLAEVEKERDKVRYHRNAKLEQLRLELDSGTTTDKIQQMKYYLKSVDEKLKIQNKKVQDQQKIVDSAKTAVETARKEMLQKQQDVEKIRMHKKEWNQEELKRLDHIESLNNDEIGTTIHLKTKKAKQEES